MIPSVLLSFSSEYFPSSSGHSMIFLAPPTPYQPPITQYKNLLYFGADTESLLLLYSTTNTIKVIVWPIVHISKPYPGDLGMELMVRCNRFIMTGGGDL